MIKKLIKINLIIVFLLVSLSTASATIAQVTSINITNVTQEDTLTIIHMNISFSEGSTDTGFVLMIDGESNGWTYPRASNAYIGVGISILRDNNTHSICADEICIIYPPLPPTPFWIIYDINNDGIIQKSEAIQAVVDYFSGAISKQNAIAIVVMYFQG